MKRTKVIIFLKEILMRLFTVEILTVIYLIRENIFIGNNQIKSVTPAGQYSD